MKWELWIRSVRALRGLCHFVQRDNIIPSFSLEHSETKLKLVVVLGEGVVVKLACVFAAERISFKADSRLFSVDEIII